GTSASVDDTCAMMVLLCVSDALQLREGRKGIYGHSHRRSASPLQPADRRVGRRVAAAESPAVARAGRAGRPGQPPRLRPDVLPLPGERARRRRPQPGLHRHLRLSERLPALLTETLDLPVATSSILRAAGVRGTCRVLCFSPRHDLTLASMPVDGIRQVVDVWVEQTAELGQRYRWVQIFENKGEMMGVSNLYPHGQIWALDA